MIKLALLKLLLAKYILLLALLHPIPKVTPPLILGGSPPATIVVQVASTTATTTQTYGFYDTFKSATGTLIVKTSTLSAYNALLVKGSSTCAGCGTWVNSFHGYH